MRITVNNRNVFIFPTGLVINRVTSGFIRKKLKKEGLQLTRKQTQLFIKAIRYYKRNHSDWNLVEIEDADGDTVKIKI
ncbi:MAG: hypothetical protein E7634_09000 [Ruminococcaceae bacterium]|nr:hypothetical protein [Oscillospiraceae bacterium]